jgi:hypothetical protein
LARHDFVSSDYSGILAGFEVEAARRSHNLRLGFIGGRQPAAARKYYSGTPLSVNVKRIAAPLALTENHDCNSFRHCYQQEVFRAEHTH